MSFAQSNIIVLDLFNETWKCIQTPHTHTHTYIYIHIFLITQLKSGQSQIKFIAIRNIKQYKEMLMKQLSPTCFEAKNTASCYYSNKCEWSTVFGRVVLHQTTAPGYLMKYTSIILVVMPPWNTRSSIKWKKLNFLCSNITKYTHTPVNKLV